MNGNAWTKDEIDLLVNTAEAGGCLEQLAHSLQRSPRAVQSKANRLSLRPAAQTPWRPDAAATSFGSGIAAAHRPVSAALAPSRHRA